jgi:hypothetical protein
VIDRRAVDRPAVSRRADTRPAVGRRKRDLRTNTRHITRNVPQYLRENLYRLPAIGNLLLNVNLGHHGQRYRIKFLSLITKLTI